MGLFVPNKQTKKAGTFRLRSSQTFQLEEVSITSFCLFHNSSSYQYYLYDGQIQTGIKLLDSTTCRSVILITEKYQ